MKKFIFTNVVRIPNWVVRVLLVAIYLLSGIKLMAQAPAPTDPYIADVTSYGATANDATDDTHAIQNAINDVSQNHPGGTVLVPDGTYWVTVIGSAPWYALSLKSNITFKMTSGAIIKVKPTDSGSYFVLDLERVTNVNIVGGTVQGERHQHLVAGDHGTCCPNVNGEWGYGIYVNIGSSNVYIDGVTLKEMWGDGVCIGGATGGDANCNKNINLYNVICDDNRRQGMSISEADGVTVKNCSFTNTSGASPSAGVDIEPWGGGANGEWAKNIQFINCRFDNNDGAGVILSSMGDATHGYADISNITVTGCTMNNNKWDGFAGIGYGLGIVVTDNVIRDNIRSGGIVIRGEPSTGGVFSNNHIYHTITLDHSNLSGIEITANATGNTIENNDVHGNYFAAVRDDVGGNTINDNTFNADPDDPNISVVPSSLSFGTFPTDSISPEQFYTLTGSNLLGNVTVTAASGYLISTTSGTGFKAQLTITTPTLGNVNQTIYVQFKPRKGKVYNGSIYNSTPGDNINNVAVTGIGTDPTGIDETIKNENVIVSPNPFHTNFRVQISSELKIKNAAIKIYDLTGKEVKTVSINQNETILSRKGMENGIYFYSIINNNYKIANGKLIVQ